MFNQFVGLVLTFESIVQEKIMKLVNRNRHTDRVDEET